MTEIEDRTGIIRRFLRCREAVSNAEQAAEAIERSTAGNMTTGRFRRISILFVHPCTH